MFPLLKPKLPFDLWFISSLYISWSKSLNAYTSLGPEITHPFWSFCLLQVHCYWTGWRFPQCIFFSRLKDLSAFSKQREYLLRKKCLPDLQGTSHYLNMHKSLQKTYLSLIVSIFNSTIVSKVKSHHRWLCFLILCKLREREIVYIYTHRLIILFLPQTYFSYINSLGFSNYNKNFSLGNAFLLKTLLVEEWT